ncbi:MAG TPA: RluA family pseudouridine synthase [Burkholderiaceae bacterium]
MLSVDEESGAGQRLDNFLARQCKGVPRSHLYQLIRSGQVRVDGRRCRADDRLEAGATVRVPPIVLDAERGARGRAAPPGSFPVIFEDGELLVIDKPAGVAVHGGSGVAHGAVEQLRAAHPESRFLELCHRIDRDTSGVLVLARKRAALLSVHRQLRDRQVEKSYLAIVHGRWPLRTKSFEQPLMRYLTPEGERRVRVQADGQEAITRVTGLRHFALAGLGTFTLVEASIETGRTHQIRVHLAHAGFPIAGDQKYGDFALNRSLRKGGHARMFLHAHSLRIRHPSSNRVLELAAPRPADFDALIDEGAAPEAREP